MFEFEKLQTWIVKSFVETLYRASYMSAPCASKMDGVSSTWSPAAVSPATCLFTQLVAFTTPMLAGKLTARLWLTSSSLRVLSAISDGPTPHWRSQN